MSLVQIYNFPRPNDQASFDLWAFANADSHNRIIASIEATKKTSLIRYVLYPIAQSELNTFLFRHQQTHNDMSTVLSFSGNDFTNIDFNDPISYEEVLYLHAEDHRKAEEQLKL